MTKTVILSESTVDLLAEGLHLAYQAGRCDHDEYDGLLRMLRVYQSVKITYFEGDTDALASGSEASTS